MGYYGNTEVCYSGDMPGGHARGVIMIGGKTYEVRKKTMLKFQDCFGREAIEGLECFAIDILVNHKIQNEGYFTLLK